MILSPSPATLWTPPAPRLWLPQWVRRLTEWYTDEIQEGSDGGMKEGSDGGMRQANGTSTPCCCSAPGGCAVCTSIPDTVTAVVHNVTVDCCNNLGSTSTRLLSPDGTYTLTRGAGASCVWTYSSPTSTVYLNNYFSSGTCGGSPDPASPSAFLNIIMTVTAGPNVRVQVVHSNTHLDETVAWDCSTSIVGVTNSIAPCSVVGTDSERRGGGTVTITW